MATRDTAQGVPFGLHCSGFACPAWEGAADLQFAQALVTAVGLHYHVATYLIHPRHWC